MSSGPFHFKEAERLIDKAQRIMGGFPCDEYAQTIATAQVHAIHFVDHRCAPFKRAAETFSQNGDPVLKGTLKKSDHRLHLSLSIKLLGLELGYKLLAFLFRNQIDLVFPFLLLVPFIRF